MGEILEYAAIEFNQVITAYVQTFKMMDTTQSFR